MTLRTYGRGRLHDLGLVGPVTEAYATVVEHGLARALGADGDPARFDVDLDAVAAWLDDARAVLARAAVGLRAAPRPGARRRARAAQLGGWPLGFAELVAAQLGRLTGHLERVRADAEAALEDLDGAGDVAWAQGLAFDILVDAVPFRFRGTLLRAYHG